MISKQEIRREIAAKRNVLDPRRVADASASIVGHFQTLEAFQTSEMVALYKAIGGEVILESLFGICWRLGKRTCIPIFNGQKKIYEMTEITENTALKTGHYGIQEPVRPVRTDMGSIDLIAVPGIAFDLQGHRLGRGGGYYDRLLSGYRGFTVGVAFDLQLIPLVPTDIHDKSVDFVITEAKIVKV